MSKSKSKMSMLFLIGMALVVVGFCLPITAGKLFGSTQNGFNIAGSYFNNKDSFMGICAYATFVAAAIGIIESLIAHKAVYDILCLAVSVAGGLVLYFNMGSFAQGFTKAFFTPGVGLYLIIAGWVVGLVAAILSFARK